MVMMMMKTTSMATMAAIVQYNLISLILFLFSHFRLISEEKVGKYKEKNMDEANKK